MVKVLILRTAGTNCNDELDYAFKMAGASTEQVHINELISKQKKLESYSILALPGGFSYGDYISAGTILANQLSVKLKDGLEKFITTGNVIVGICNGFQALVKTGFLPGSGLKASLVENDSGKFECRWITLIAEKSKFVKNLNSLDLPVAHGQGKFVCSEDTIKILEKNNQVVFRYSASKYPHNPNGSLNNIAGISNLQGNVIGLMPHPERHLTCQNHPNWNTKKCKTPNGLQFFKNMVEYCNKSKNESISVISR